MFNGIIFNKGIVNKIKKSTKGVNIFVKSNLKVKKKDLGVSICCDGVCLTMVSLKNKIMEFYLLKETMNRSKFKNISIGDKINLELPLKYGQKISGHLCQGHVDCTSKVNKIIKKGKKKLLKVKMLYEGPVEAPISKDQVLAKLKIIYDDELIDEYDLLAKEQVNKVNIFSRLMKSLNYLIWGDV